MIFPPGIFLFAFLLRFLYIYQFKGGVLSQCLSLDPKYYSAWAIRIAKGDWLGGREVFEMTPLYAYFLAFFYKFLTTDLFIIRLIQITIGSLSCVILYRIAKDLLESGIMGAVAGFAAAAYGPFIFYDGMIMKPFLEVFFALLMIFFLMTGRGYAHYFLSGASLGLAALLRENIVVLIPVIPLLIFLSRKGGPKRQALLSGLFFTAGVFLIILPVAYRNFYFSGELVPITSGGGEVFYIGNNPEADGTYIEPEFVRPDPFHEHEDFRRKARELTGKNLTRKEASDFWFSEGVRFIEENPAAFIRLLGRKFMLFWNFYELPDNENYYFQRVRSNVLGKPLLHFGIVAPLGLLGMLLSMRRAPLRFALLYAVFLTYMASVLLVFNFARFRILAVSILIIFAAYSLSIIIEALKNGRMRRLLLILPILIFFYSVSNYNYLNKDPYRLKFDTAYANLGNCYLDARKFDDAYGLYGKSLEINGAYPPALLGLGDVYYFTGRVAPAEDAYLAAIKGGPESPEPYYRLARLFLDNGRPIDAGRMIEKAAALER